MAHSQLPVVRSERIYEGEILNLRVDHVALPDGRQAVREIVEHGGAVAVVPVDGEGQVHMVRQFREAIERDLLEIPAGGIEPGEDPHACAERELQEEIGMFPGKLVPLGGFYPVPGYSSEYIHLFLAMALEPSDLPADEGEFVSVERVPLADLLKRIQAGGVEDGKTIAGVMRAAIALAALGQERPPG